MPIHILLLSLLTTFLGWSIATQATPGHDAKEPVGVVPFGSNGVMKTEKLEEYSPSASMAKYTAFICSGAKYLKAPRRTVSVVLHEYKEQLQSLDRFVARKAGNRARKAKQNMNHPNTRNVF
jgi:hypothetical protein